MPKSTVHHNSQVLVIYVEYASPNESCAWIAMTSILESMVVEIVEVLFGTPDFWSREDQDFCMVSL